MAINRSIPITGSPAVKAEVRANWSEIGARIDELPTVWSGEPGSMVGGTNAESGLELLATTANFRRQKVVGAGWDEKEVTGSRNLSDVLDRTSTDRGKILYSDTASNITLTITFDTGAVAYVVAGFVCRLWRIGSGKLRIVPGTGLLHAGGNPDNHSYVQAGRMAEVYASPQGILYFDGYTEAS
jgi:hypothetical protein